jgi:hypothetical protein
LAQWRRSGVWLAAALSILIYLHAAFEILPLPPGKDPIARSAGWRDVAGAAHLAGLRNDGPGISWFAADRYQDAAQLAFHLPAHPTTFSLNLSGRGNEYDLWPDFADRAHPGDNLVLVVDEVTGTNPIVSQLAPHFQSVSRDSLVELRSRHGLVSQRRLWVLHSWTGGWPTRS